MGKKYIISDTHIGERGWIDDFANKEQNLVCLLKNIAGDNSEDDPGELILLGDFFDFLEVTSKSKNDQDIEVIISQIAKRYKFLFQEISNYLGKKQKLFYVCGNHDYYMRFPKLYQLVAQKFLPPDIDLAEGYRLFQVNDHYVSRKYRIYGEHGHRFDKENWHHNGMPECLGSLLVKNFLIKWEQRYPSMDNLRPRGNLFYLIKDLSEQNGQDPKDQVEKLLRDMDEVHKEYLKICRRHGFVHKEVSQRSSTIQKLLTVLKGPEWLDSVILRLAEGSIVDALNENCTTYRKKAKELMDLDNEEYIANQKDLDFQPDYFIFGHTHFFDHKILENGKHYFNTASWLNTLFYNQDKKLVHIDNIIAKAPVLVFNQRGEDPVLYDITDSGKMEEKDFQEIAELYKKHGVIF